MWRLVRAVLFGLDAERAHAWTIRLLGTAPRLWGGLARLVYGEPPPELARTVGGVRVAGPVGLAAGLDKDGVAIPFWPALGFGFVEVGTVTAHPQEGNPRPRLHRLVPERALVNRLGFNNAGSEDLARRLRALRDAGHWPQVPIGANVGKSAVTPLSEAVGDYVASVRRLAGLADWITVNVSSPNTVGLRGLQDRDALAALLPAVVGAAGNTPVWLKLAPDLSDDALVAAVELAREAGLRAAVATNTTLSRPGLPEAEGLQGGLSGRPLYPLAKDRLRVVLGAAGSLDVVGVGGIETAAQVEELLGLGCAAVQLYSSLVFEGPGLPWRLHRALADAAVRRDP
jgi:dihydroorotate dehydrogenase